jgi:hypothetical protein
MPKSDAVFTARLNPRQEKLFDELCELCKGHSPPLTQRHKIGQGIRAWREAVREKDRPGTFAELAKELGVLECGGHRFLG